MKMRGERKNVLYFIIIPIFCVFLGVFLHARHISGDDDFHENELRGQITNLEEESQILNEQIANLLAENNDLVHQIESLEIRSAEINDDERISEEPLAMLDEYRDYDLNLQQSTNLLTLSPVRSSGWNPGTGMNQVVLSHERGWGIVFSADAEFFIDGKYTILRGTITADETLNPESRMQLLIFADDDLLFESDYIQRATSVDFEVDVSGVRFIHIFTQNIGASGSITVSDLILSR